MKKDDVRINKTDEESRIQAQTIINETDQDIEEEYALPPLEVKNLYSWLLIFTPDELAVISSILAIIITKGLTLEEKAVIGAFLTALADTIFLIAAQEALINSAIEEQKAIDDREKELIQKQQEKLKAKKDKLEQDKKDQEINEMKEKINRLEELINKQLRI